MNRSVNACDGEQGAEHTGETLTGQKISGDCEHVHVNADELPFIRRRLKADMEPIVTEKKVWGMTNPCATS